MVSEGTVKSTPKTDRHKEKKIINTCYVVNVCCDIIMTCYYCPRFSIRLTICDAANLYERLVDRPIDANLDQYVFYCLWVVEASEFKDVFMFFAPTHCK